MTAKVFCLRSRVQSVVVRCVSQALGHQHQVRGCVALHIECQKDDSASVPADVAWMG